MADKEEASSGGENTTRGTDWEVVSLTASAYAASPGPKVHDDDVTTTTPPSEAETSHPLYMSGHFVFPPTEPPSALDNNNNNNNKASKKMDSDLSLEPDEFAFLDEEEKGKRDERNIYKTCLQDEQSSVTPPEQLEDDDDDEVAANSSPWWKRSAASFISQAKETKTVWSIFIAAAVMGVVVLGKRWQRERWQLLQLNWESTIANNEKAGRLMGPISRLKQAFVGGQRRDSFIRSQKNDS